VERREGLFEEKPLSPLHATPLSSKPFEEKVCKGRKGFLRKSPLSPCTPLSPKPFENSRERQVNR